MTRHGLPAAVTPGSTERVTTLPAPMMASCPISTPGSTITPPPSHARAPIDDRVCRLQAARALGRVARVVRRQQLDARSELHVVAERDRRRVEEDAAHVDEHPGAEPDLRAVVAVEAAPRPTTPRPTSPSSSRSSPSRAVGVGRVERAESLGEPPGANARLRRARGRSRRRALRAASSRARSLAASLSADVVAALTPARRTPRGCGPSRRSPARPRRGGSRRLRTTPSVRRMPSRSGIVASKPGTNALILLLSNTTLHVLSPSRLPVICGATLRDEVGRNVHDARPRRRAPRRSSGRSGSTSAPRRR